MNYKLVITIILLIIYTSINYYLNWIIWSLGFLVTIWFYTIIFYTFHILWCKLLKKEIKESLEYIKSFLFRISIFILFLVWTLSWLSYLSNEIYPAKMYEYTLSDWEKIVKFQSMVHIWSEKFYNRVLQNVEKFKKDWWVLFFEWVRPWSEENMEKFNKALWIEFTSELYENFSKLYWVTFQDNEIFLWLENDLDFNVDLNIDDIIKMYEEKNLEYWNEKTYNNPINADEKILEAVNMLNEKQLKVLVYINKAILNLMIWNEKIQTTLSNNFTNKELFEVIIWERDKLLANEVNDSEYEKIYITYWALHFNWFFNELKKLNSEWEIINTKYLFPIK